MDFINAFVVPADDNYCFAVACDGDAGFAGGANATCATDYVFFVNVFTLDVDHDEPNDSLAAATPIAAPFFDAALTLYPAGDVDFFRFDAKAGATANVGLFGGRNFPIP